jgi:hypothetical protein
MYMKHLAAKTLAILLTVTLSATASLAEDKNASKYPPYTQYVAMMMDGKKIGYGVLHFRIKDGKAVTNRTVKITMSRGGTDITLIIKTLEIETLDGKPLSFEYKVDPGQRVIAGKIGSDGKLRVERIVAGVKQNKVVDWPKGAVMSHGQMINDRKAGLKPGTKITRNDLDYTTLTPKTVTSLVGEKTKVDLLGRVAMLTEIKSVTQSASGKENSSRYVDDKFLSMKEITQGMGMILVAVDCSKAVAMGTNDTVDLTSKTALPSPVKLSRKATRGPLIYTIKPTSTESDLQFLDGANQSVKTAKDKTITLTIRPTPAPKNVPIGYKGKDPVVLKALKPSQYVQSNHKSIKILAKRAVGNAKDAATAAIRIERFVRGYIRTKNLSVGYASAVEVAKNRKGDCTEHAVLTAAICRAAGIPAQVLTGLTYVGQYNARSNVFGPHAWNRVFIGGKWIGIDSALRGFDTGHIALALNDDDKDMIGFRNTLGNFKIISIKTLKEDK